MAVHSGVAKYSYNRWLESGNIQPFGFNPWLDFIEHIETHIRSEITDLGIHQHSNSGEYLNNFIDIAAIKASDYDNEADRAIGVNTKLKLIYEGLGFEAVEDFLDSLLDGTDGRVIIRTYGLDNLLVIYFVRINPTEHQALLDHGYSNIASQLNLTQQYTMIVETLLYEGTSTDPSESFIFDQHWGLLANKLHEEETN